MKKLITILFLLPILVIGQENNWKLQPDKIYHASAGVIISEVSYIPYYSGKWDFRTSTKVAFWGSLSIACYKEMADSYGQTGWSWQDIGYTMAGTITTIGLNYLVYKIRKKKRLKLCK